MCPAARCRPVALFRPDEVEHLAPGIGRCVRVLLELAVEEGVRRTLVDDETVLDARRRERAIELVARLGRDRGVIAAEQPEHRAAETRRLVGRRGQAGPTGNRGSVEPDDTLEPDAARR